MHMYVIKKYFSEKRNTILLLYYNIMVIGNMLRGFYSSMHSVDIRSVFDKKKHNRFVA